MNMHVQYRFHPVGQGLFSAGRLTLGSPYNHPSGPDFQWVYDCGTSSSQRLVRNALGKFQSRINGRKLDLVVISHFDADHISGMVQLINDVGTRTLMLPWAPLWHRLVIGYAQGLDPDDPDFAFYTDPARSAFEHRSRSRDPP
jgi:glyoxylase-like metal-dependent hydrolase (beta-lactamase superfamily II)